MHPLDRIGQPDQTGSKGGERAKFETLDNIRELLTEAEWEELMNADYSNLPSSTQAIIAKIQSVFIPTRH